MTVIIDCHGDNHVDSSFDVVSPYYLPSGLEPRIKSHLRQISDSIDARSDGESFKLYDKHFEGGEAYKHHTRVILDYNISTKRLAVTHIAYPCSMTSHEHYLELN